MGARAQRDAPRAQRRPQKGPRGRIAPPPLDGKLIDPGPLLTGAVEIGVERQARRRASLQKRDDQRMGRVLARADVQRPALPAPGIGAIGVVLDRPVGRQHRVAAPAAVAADRRPVIVIRQIAPNPHHRVDRRRPAQQLAPRPVITLTVQPGVGLGPVVPVHRAVKEQLAIPQGHLNKEPPVGAACLEQQDPLARRRQPLGQNTARRPRADDRIVEFPVHPGPPHPVIVSSRSLACERTPIWTERDTPC